VDGGFEVVAVACVLDRQWLAAVFFGLLPLMWAGLADATAREPVAVVKRLRHRSRLHRCDPVPLYPATDRIIVAALLEAGRELGRDTVLVARRPSSRT
jgi:hypothetical protein